MKLQFDTRSAAQTATEYEAQSSSLTPRRSPLPQPSLFPASPSTILLGLWPGAQTHEVDHYIQGYKIVYPSADIILLQSSPRSSSGSADSALYLLTKDTYKSSGISLQDTLIHIFGDHAAAEVCQLLRVYRLRTQQPLGIGALILDTAPPLAPPSYRTFHTAPQHILISIYLFCVALYLRISTVLSTLFSKSCHTQVNRDLQDPKLVPPTAKKCFIFPEKQIMFAWDRVGGETEISERREFDVRRGKGRRRRVGGRKAWTGDQERYWLGIEDAWGGR